MSRGWSAHLIYFAEACVLLRVDRRAGRSITSTLTTGPTRRPRPCSAGISADRLTASRMHGPEEFDAPSGIGLRREDPACAVSWSRSASSLAASSIGGPITMNGPRSRWSVSGVSPMFLDPSVRCPSRQPRDLVSIGRIVEQKGPADLDPGRGTACGIAGVDFELDPRG